MNRKKILIVICVVLVIAAIAFITVFVIKNINKDSPTDNNIINNSVRVTGTLEQYIANLTDNYYIKYSGKFKNNSGNPVQAIVEYTKSGDNYALRSTELDINLVCEGQKLSSISNTYEIIVEMPKTSLDISEYNLASDIGQTFVKSYKEKLDGTECDVEEYRFNGKVLKYYFKDNNIRLIRYDGQDIKVIRLELKTNEELFVKPNGYVKQQLIDITHTSVSE